ncbi:hypothetical protein KL941_001989 [Ogataea angusta]|nr:hypothetical protein KL941_001989 [Ogataea angusta]
MALLETIQRKITKYGLLPKLVRFLPKVSTLLTLLGLIWILILPLDGQFRTTYISENALMPSQAYSFFRESEWNFVRGYRDQIIEHIDDPMDERHEMLSSWMKTIGYKTFEYRSANDSRTTYGIYHVPKGDDTEAMVIVAPWTTSDGEKNIGGLALTMGLIRYFHRLSIWSKNIIVVFPEDGQDTLRKWVDAYHTTLDETGGSMESAIVIEYSSESDELDYVEVKYVGVNGQLPNLDLVNCAVMISEHEGFKVSLHNTPKGQLWANDYPSRLTTLLKGLFSMATAGLLPETGGGNGCEAFSGWNVQTLTFKARGTEGRDITTLGRVIEACFRAVNNLLEKFHQSFFFYLLLTPNHFVSIGNYLPAAVLTASSFVISSLSAFLTNNNVNNKHINFNDAAIKVDTFPLMNGLLLFTTVTVGSIIVGTLLMWFSSIVSFADNNNLYTKLTWGLILATTTVSTLPVVLRYKSQPSAAISQTVRVANGCSLFYLAFALVSLLVLHFSLSLLISLAAFPLTFIRYGPLRQNRKNSIWLILSSPFLWLAIVGVARKMEFQLDIVRNLIQYFSVPLLKHELQTKIFDTDWLNPAFLQNLLQGPVEIFYGLLTGYRRFQTWTWMVISFAWLPVWIMSLIITCIDVQIGDFEKRKVN